MKLTNIENIISELRKRLTKVNTFNGIDGITVECIINDKANREEVMEEVKQICKELKLTSPLTEAHKDKELAFALQFPDLDVQYTDSEFKQLVEDTLKFILDNMCWNNQKAMLTKDVIIHNKGLFIKQVIGIYYNSHSNKYKENIKDLLNNQELRQKIESIFDEYIKTYEYTGKNIVVNGKEETI